MLTVEDILETIVADWLGLNQHFPDLDRNRWYNKFFANVYEQVKNERPLSVAQGRVILDYAKTCRVGLIDCGLPASQVDYALSYPSYRMPPYESVRFPREVRYLGDNKLAFRFKRDDSIRDSLKYVKPKSPFAHDDQQPYWYYPDRLWIISITRDNLEKIMTLISTYHFKYDQTVAEYLTLATNSKGQNSTFAYCAETNQIVVNVCDNEFVATWLQMVLNGEKI